MAKTVFILGAGASHTSGTPLMGNFIDAARRLRPSINNTHLADAFDLVFLGISALQLAHSKSDLDIYNLESVFAAFEMARLFRHPLGSLSGSKRDLGRDYPETFATLGRSGAPFRHQPGNRPLGNLDSQLQQFSMDAWCTPAHIGFRHRLHQFSDISVGSWPPWILVLGQPGPVSFEPPPLPIDHGFGPDNHQRRLPLFPDFPQTHPEQSIRWSNLRTTKAALEDPQLLAKCDILQRDLLIAPKNQKHRTKNGQDCVQHDSESVSASSLKINHLRNRLDYGEPQVDPSGPSLYTALQEQLGLRLESRKGPVDVLVVDYAEKVPADN
jgi:hypothetical protein